MQNSNDDLNGITYIHIRPGIEAKGHPIGTVAIAPGDEPGLYHVGYSVQHSRLDSWNGKRGRQIAGGRAVASKERITIEARNITNRELLLRAVNAVFDAAHCLNRINVTRQFVRALSDTAARLEMHEEIATTKRVNGTKRT